MNYYITLNCNDTIFLDVEWNIHIIRISMGTAILHNCSKPPVRANSNLIYLIQID